MDLALILSRFLLAATFMVAGLAKLADQAGTKKAVTEFGIGGSLARPLVLALPVAELLVAVALIPTSSARWGALGGVALLVSFIAAIGLTLRRGQKPDCHCFGQMRPTPIGTPTLVRNGILLAIATFAAARSWSNPGPGLTHSFAGVDAGQIAVVVALALVAVVGFEGWMLLGMFAQQGRLLARLEEVESALERGAQAGPYIAGLPIGSLAPEFSLPTTTGGDMSLELLRWPGRPVMLVFTDPDCSGCRDLLSDLESWHANPDGTFAVALISRSGETYGDPDGPPVLMQSGEEVSEQYRVNGTPSAVVVRADGIIAAPLVAGPDAIRQLAETMNGEPCGDTSRQRGAEGLNRPVLTLPRVPQVGAAAPSVALRNLDGQDVDLKDFLNEEIALLFWSPTCDFCQRILGDLKGLEVDERSRKLVIISSGPVNDNRAQGFRSPVLLDDGSVSPSFGADGTPMAVLIDSDGRIASTMAAGAPAVLELVQSPQRVNVPPSASNGRKPSGDDL